MAYNILIKESAQAELARLPARDRARVEQRIEALAENPRPANATALQGKTFKGLFRIRSGDYRIIYQVLHQELIVLVIKVGNRRDVYE